MSSPTHSGKHAQVASFPSEGNEPRQSKVLELLRAETIGGALLIVGAILALVWANSPWSSSYFALRDFEIGYAPLHLRLSLGQWAADGLLAIFFFMVGLELKREFVDGDLRKFSTAVVPITAAAGGVVVPALIYTALVVQHPDAHGGWAIPTATDIAFAVSVLALVGKHLPSALRIFLLTLAVIDDLIAITIIAFFYSTDIKFVPLFLSLAIILIYGLIVQRYRSMFATNTWAAWAILLPIGIAAWGFMHVSGIHATISGVLLAFTVPVKARRGSAPSADDDLAGQFEHRFSPLSAGFAVPVFAFFSAGVAMGSLSGYLEALSSPVAVAIMAGLVVGKPIGITVTTWLLTRFRSISLDRSIRWIDLFGLSILAAIGFTVSFLIGELSFAAESAAYSEAKVGILTASVVAVILSSFILVPRSMHYKAEKQKGALAAK